MMAVDQEPSSTRCDGYGALYNYPCGDGATAASILGDCSINCPKRSRNCIPTHPDKAEVESFAVLVDAGYPTASSRDAFSDRRLQRGRHGDIAGVAGFFEDRTGV